MLCANCGSDIPDGAYYCPQCGEPVALPELEPERQKSESSLTFRWDMLFLSVVGFSLLTLVLTTVFHLPIFIAGAFLPFLWTRRQRVS